MAVLNELWNRDKHRNLTLAATYVADAQIFIADPHGRSLVGGQFQQGPVGDDEIIGVFRFADGDVSPDAEVQAGGRLFVAFADECPWGVRPVTEILEGLHQYVAVTVVPQLKAFC